MKTVDTVALEIIAEWKGKNFHTESQETAALQVAIIEALKQQDKKTRHACAEAVISLDGYMDGPPFGCSKLVVADEAHAACMNVKTL